ncbi:head maturation protease, ClpP-related [Ferviditalea candida]|uniref:ATP-dependent Clp protease proteolytic subunit n=1 Tax=Ferviditalea candida TaxID=3108399 RepID=A0ABU5ZKN5_9BACL|nr:head maturation protease, ClpP-related [Paenibacillaceae bacterium T2]
MTKFWSFKNLSDEEVELRIEGEIVSDDDAWIYEWFDIQHTSPNAFRQALAEQKGKNISLWIDSWGGDVFAAAGIYNALKEHNGKVTAKVDGKAVSAASVIAMAANEVLMSPVSVMMIHNPWSMAMGEAKDMRHAADVLDEVKNTIINAYQLKTGLSRNKISNLMDAETWMSARKAMTDGFADGMLYSDSGSEEESVQNSFSFSGLAIQNSTDAAMKRFFEALKNNKIIPEDKHLKGRDEEVEIKNVEELKMQFPDLCNQLIESVKAEGAEGERNRLRAIDEIASTVPQNLVSKAKYETPMTAEALAFEALKANAAAGQAFAAQRENELNPNNQVPAASDPSAQSKQEQETAIVAKIAAGANQKRGMKEGNNQ